MITTTTLDNKYGDFKLQKLGYDKLTLGTTPDIHWLFER